MVPSAAAADARSPRIASPGGRAANRKASATTAAAAPAMIRVERGAIQRGAGRLSARNGAGKGEVVRMVKRFAADLGAFVAGLGKHNVL